MARSRYQPGPSQSLCGRDLGGEAAVAALGHLADVHLQPLLALVAVQPEQRAGQSPGLDRQLPKLPFQRGHVLLARQGRRRDRAEPQTARHQNCVSISTWQETSWFRLWSAAIHRRFLCVAALGDGSDPSAESGDKSPHSNGLTSPLRCDNTIMVDNGGDRNRILRQSSAVLRRQCSPHTPVRGMSAHGVCLTTSIAGDTPVG